MAMNANPTLDAGTSAWRNPWVIGWIALVVVVLLANATMVYLAISTNPGLVVPNYYERGRDMERTIISRAAAAPDWTVRIDSPPDIAVGQPVAVRVFVVDRAGQPVTPGQIAYRVYRPSDAQRDFSIPMTAEGPGRYVARVVFPLPGIWDTLVTVEDGESEHNLGLRIGVAAP